MIRINKIIYSSSGVARAFPGGRGRNEEENEEKLRNNERSYRKMRKDGGNHQGGSQPHSPGWARVPLSSFFLKSRLSFLIFPAYDILRNETKRNETKRNKFLRGYSFKKKSFFFLA